MMNSFADVSVGVLLWISLTYVSGTLPQDPCMTRYKDLLDKIPNAVSAPERCEYMSPVFTCQLNLTGTGQPTIDNIRAVKDLAGGQCNETIDAIVEAYEVNQEYQTMTFNRDATLVCWKYFEMNVNYTLPGDVKCDIFQNFSKCIIKTYGSSRPDADVLKRVLEVLSDHGTVQGSFCPIDPYMLMNEVWGSNDAMITCHSLCFVVVILSVLTSITLQQ